MTKFVCHRAQWNYKMVDKCKCGTFWCITKVDVLNSSFLKRNRNMLDNSLSLLRNNNYYIMAFCYRNRYDDFDAPRKLSGDPNHPANDLSSPESIQSVERPPLRYVDMYIMPEIPGITKRNTVALLSCMGFIIMFGMRTIMGIVKLEIKVSFYFVKLLVRTLCYTSYIFFCISNDLFYKYFIYFLP